jgi:hypothetical protein
MRYFRNYSKSAVVVPQALAIDAELGTWAGNYPPEYEYSTLPVVTMHEKKILSYNRVIYDDCYYFHVYTSISIANVWNNYRRIRILIHELLLEHMEYLLHQELSCPHFLSTTELPFALNPPLPWLEKQMSISKELLGNLTRDICLSVPFFFGFHLKGGSGSPNTPKAVCGDFLLWPLYMAAEPTYSSRKLRQWVLVQFERISEVMGIKQALVIAQMLRDEIDVEVWEDRDEKEHVPAE